jgi:CDGSH-type Zn-finger protein/uncharacterized Fe-S cluster protein YjdI
MTMAEEQTLRLYHGEKIDVTWDAKRCIHEAECLRRLGAVFDRGRRPWVLPDAAPADQVAETITHCPTGALHFIRKDGGAAEAAYPVNTVTPDVDGPLFLRGDIVIETPKREVVLKDMRVALCRCGASKNKPFCDKTHDEIGFQHNGVLGENEVQVEAIASKLGPLKIVPSKNGPFQLYGPFELRGSDEKCYTGSSALLCRCGGSSNKPFCDDTHLRNGFKSE